MMTLEYDAKAAAGGVGLRWQTGRTMKKKTLRGAQYHVGLCCKSRDFFQELFCARTHIVKPLLSSSKNETGKHLVQFYSSPNGNISFVTATLEQM